MKLTVFLILFGVLRLSADTYAQTDSISLDLSNATCKEALDAIKKQTKLDFFYNNQEINAVGKVSVRCQNVSLDEALRQVLGKNFTFRIVDNTVVIRPQETKPDPVQQRVAKGVVVDVQGLPLPGVTVLLKGTTLGTSTDMDGKFTLSFPNTAGTVLQFSFIGMKTTEVTFSGQAELKIVLEEETTQMDEVVVTGIFERKSESFTGSATTYKKEDLKMMGSQNILQSLKTLDPSFHITPNNEFGSDPNKLPDIDIRGKTSIVNLKEDYAVDPNQPLFILDGFEVDLQTIVDLNMERVASVTILKDAASTAIYGSRAANGVVVVETKRPAPGTLRLSYNGDLTVQMPDLSDYNMMNAAEKLEFEWLTGYYTKTSNEEYLVDRMNLYNQRLKNVQSGVDTYWLSEPVRTGFSHKHNMYVEGGDDAMLYGVGLSYNGTQGVMKQSGRDVLSFNIDLRYRKGKFSFDNKFTLDYTESQNAPQSFSVYVQTNPYYPKDYEGSVPKYLEESSVDGGFWSIKVENPLYNASLNYLDDAKEISFRNNF